MLLEHVISSAKRSAIYLNRHQRTNGLSRVALLIPVGDPIQTKFGHLCEIFTGPENDVLTRYKLAADAFESDYIVRITGDCPMIQDYMISKHVTVAVANGYDYAANCYEEYRTVLDGMDVEIFSKKLLDWMHDSAENNYDREHVTAIVRERPPSWAKMAFIGMSPFDFSKIKLSVDTEEDLDRVREAYAAAKKKDKEAIKRFGKQHVHHF